MKLKTYLPCLHYSHVAYLNVGNKEYISVTTVTEDVVSLSDKSPGKIDWQIILNPDSSENSIAVA